MTHDNGSRAELDQAELFREAQRSVRPFVLIPRSFHDEYACDLVSLSDDSVVIAAYGSGPSVLLAVLVAEQRYLSEQVGHGSIAGLTYLDKARERIRRGPAVGT